jgi:hypothetical protein
MRRYTGGYLPKMKKSSNVDYSLSNATVTSDPIDWVAKGAVTPVKVALYMISVLMPIFTCYPHS